MHRKKTAENDVSSLSTNEPYVEMATNLIVWLSAYKQYKHHLMQSINTSAVRKITMHGSQRQSIIVSTDDDAISYMIVFHHVITMQSYAM